MPVIRESFGQGALFKLQQGNLSVSVAEWGATITRVCYPDQEGKTGDIMIGFDDIQHYRQGNDYHGATIGPLSNRIENSHIFYQNELYLLTANEAQHHLHGGPAGLSYRLFTGKAFDNETTCGVSFTTSLNHGEDGYPGNRIITVTYTLTNRDEICINYQAESDQDTFFSPTNHTYWHLGYDGSVRSHQLTIDSFLGQKKKENNCFSGEIARLDKTMDFSSAKTLQQALSQLPPSGLDHTYLLETRDINTEVATLFCPDSGRILKLFTDQPALHLYTAGSMQPVTTRGRSYNSFDAVCLEAHQPLGAASYPFLQPAILLRKRQLFQGTIIYALSLS